MTLKELPIGKTATVRTVGGEGALRQHFLDMGIIPGAEVTMVKYAPMGDPVEVRIHSYELTLRLADAGRIEIMEVRDAVKEKEQPDAKAIPHPGFGEGGKYHNKAEEHPLPEGELLSFALAGNQNCGKTTLFNQLTGSNQHVGNFPGVTVDRKDGEIRGQKNTLVTDLPGIYSMSPYSSEEIVTRNFVLNEHPRGIINIVDATNIERNLYLTMQLMELDVPMVLALNMMDEVRENGGSVLVNQMEERLGIPVIPISAAKNEGIEELVAHAVHVAKYRAFTVIFIATIVIWFLQTFGTHLNVVEDSKDSILAVVSGYLAPLFRPLGFGDWRVSTALLTGFMAKESVVSTLSVLFGSTAQLTGVLTPVSALSLLVFCLLYTPCVAAIASIKRELGGKWAAGVVVSQCVIAWLAAFVVHGFALLFGM